jgi:hypothetical protein
VSEVLLMIWITDAACPLAEHETGDACHPFAKLNKQYTCLDDGSEKPET